MSQAEEKEDPALDPRRSTRIAQAIARGRADLLANRRRKRALTRSQAYTIGTNLIENPNVTEEQITNTMNVMGCSRKTIFRCKARVLSGDLTHADKDVHRIFIYPEGRRTPGREETKKILSLIRPDMTRNRFFFDTVDFFWMRKAIRVEPELDTFVRLLNKATELEHLGPPPTPNELRCERAFLTRANLRYRKISGDLAKPSRLAEDDKLRYGLTLLELIKRISPSCILATDESLVSSRARPAYGWVTKGTKNCVYEHQSGSRYRATMLPIIDFNMNFRTMAILRMGLDHEFHTFPADSIEGERRFVLGRNLVNANEQKSNQEQKSAAVDDESEEEKDDGIVGPEIDEGAAPVQTNEIKAVRVDGIPHLKGADNALLHYTTANWNARITMAGKLPDDIDRRYTTEFSNLMNQVKKYFWTCCALGKAHPPNNIDEIFAEYVRQLGHEQKNAEDDISPETRRRRTNLPIIPKKTAAERMKEIRRSYVLNNVLEPDYTLEDAPYVAKYVKDMMTSGGTKHFIQDMCAEAADRAEIGWMSVEYKTELVHGFARKVHSHESLAEQKCTLPTISICANPKGWTSVGVMKDFITNVVAPLRQASNMPNNQLLVLVLDRCLAHTSWHVKKCAKDNNILLVYVPAGCTHQAQTLDVGIFGPMKKVIVRENNDAARRAHIAELEDVEILALNGQLHLITACRTAVLEQRRSSIKNSWCKVIRNCAKVVIPRRIPRNAGGRPSR